ncbi:hypothetical protein SAMN05428939_0120 [Streptomyces sp. TLI_105]|nr:hypothetical protein SAMN05428939_0120 [Streptomyces sp. TLI_105]
MKNPFARDTLPTTLRPTSPGARETLTLGTGTWKPRTALQVGSVPRRETRRGCRWNPPPRAEG